MPAVVTAYLGIIAPLVVALALVAGWNLIKSLVAW